MADLTYGTPEYYAELFADILADVDKDRPGIADAILRGFYQALDDWFIYHDHQATTYDELRQRVRKALSV